VQFGNLEDLSRFICEYAPLYSEENNNPMRMIWNAVVLSCIFYMGCEPEDMPMPSMPVVHCYGGNAPIYHPGKMEFGRVSGLKNCRPFMASAVAGIGTPNFPIIGLGLNTYEDWGWTYADKEYISIGAIGLTTGKSKLITQVDSLPNVSFTYYYTLQDHDVFEDNFELDMSYDNFIFISSIDTTDHSITGWFECRFLLRNPPSDVNPDTILFSQCFFEAEMP